MFFFKYLLRLSGIYFQILTFISHYFCFVKIFWTHLGIFFSYGFQPMAASSSLKAKSSVPLFFLPKVLLTRPFFFSATPSPHAFYFEDSCYSSLGARLVQDNHPISRPWTELSLVEHTWAEREDSQFRDAPLRFSLKISEQQRSRKKKNK